MTRRALRIATIIISIQSLLFFPAPVSRAQDLAPPWPRSYSLKRPPIFF